MSVYRDIANAVTGRYEQRHGGVLRPETLRRYVAIAIRRGTASERERAAKAEQRARVNEAEGAALRRALCLAIETIGTDMRYVALADELVMRASLDDTSAGIVLAAALDAWCAWLENGEPADADPPEQALYQAWRGMSDE